ncbi:hypothetical protein BKA93DRAFT_827172 [Sparassis latifolia]
MVERIELDDSNTLRSRASSPSYSSSEATVLDATASTHVSETANPGHTPSLCATPDEPSAHPLANAATPSHHVALPIHDGAVRYGAGDNTIAGTDYEPVSPEDMMERRYCQRHCMHVIPQSRPEEIQTIPPVKTTFAYPALPPGWTTCEHPEGCRYFRNNAQRLYTDAWIHDRTTFEGIETLGRQICHDLQQRDDVPAGTEIVLDVYKDENGLHRSYYLVREADRTIFWLHEVDVVLLSRGSRPVFDESHLKHAQEAQYWLHAGLFPNDRDITKELLDELEDLMIHQTTDAHTSETSTAPYGADDMRIHLATFKHSRPGQRPGSFCSLTKMMYVLARFMNYHGQQYARLDRDRSVYEGSDEPHSYIFLMLSPLLFYTPDLYIEELEKVWVEETAHYQPWNIFVSSLQKDWESAILPATVLLTANVGFLAIQSEDTGRPSRSVAQITSYLSTFLSLGNIIMCIILSRQHRSNAHGTATEAATYLSGRSQKIMGLELLAITFSLPGAMFLWGYI